MTGCFHSTVGWIALQYMHLSFMPAVGISIAAQAMVGKAMGSKRPDIAVARTMLALKITVGYMGLCALCFVLFREQLIEIFINEGTPPEERARLIEIGVVIMIAAAVFQVFDAVAITLAGALRGAGDTVWPGVATIVLSMGVYSRHWIFVNRDDATVGVYWALDRCFVVHYLARDIARLAI